MHVTFVPLLGKVCTCALRTGSVSRHKAGSDMATGDLARSWYRDDEIVVDKDGIPHFTGVMPELMREYRRRVLFAYTNLEGEGDDAAKEAKDMAKKQCRFAKKLVDALHGEAWRACEDLLTEPKLKEKEGYKLVFQALQAIEKVGVIKKTEAFDKFFERCHRQKGQSIDSFLRKRKQDWDNLTDIAEGVQMSDDLMAYFLLKHVNLSREDRRQILLANQSDYTVEGIEKALRVSYFDHHERERRSAGDWNQPVRRPKGRGRGHRSYAVADEEAFDDDEFYEDEEVHDEAYAIDDAEVPGEIDGHDEEPSDRGASEDDEIYDAFAAMDQHRKSYQESRQKLKQIQRNRGYFKGNISGQIKGEISYEERQKAIQKEKSRTRCARFVIDWGIGQVMQSVPKPLLIKVQSVEAKVVVVRRRGKDVVAVLAELIWLVNPLFSSEYLKMRAPMRSTATWLAASLRMSQ